jgi:DNA-binding winged helix-turn-helix (wHTH) protein
VKDGEASVNAGSLSESSAVSAIVLQRGSRTLIGPTGASVVIPWLSMQLLVALSEHSPEFVGAKQLQAMVWPDTHITPDALKQRVRLARQSLRDAGYDPGLLDSVRGEGYALRVPLHEPSDAVVATHESPSTPAVQTRSGSASVVTRNRVGAVVALCIVAALVVVAFDRWPLFVRERAQSVVAPSIGPVPVRVTLIREVSAEPAVDAALDALHASARRTFVEHANVLIVPMPNGSACVNSPPSHLCARIVGALNQVRLEVTDVRSGASLVQGEWTSDNVPDTLLTDAKFAAQLAVLLSPGALRWIGEARGRGDRDFAAVLNAAKASAHCDVELWRDARRTLDETAERAPQFQVARALRALLTVASTRGAAGGAASQTAASELSDAVTDADTLLQADAGQSLAHAAKWLHAVSSVPSTGTDSPREAEEYERLGRASPSVARLAEHLRSCADK